MKPDPENTWRFRIGKKPDIPHGKLKLPSLDLLQSTLDGDASLISYITEKLQGNVQSFWTDPTRVSQAMLSLIDELRNAIANFWRDLDGNKQTHFKAAFAAQDRVR